MKVHVCCPQDCSLLKDSLGVLGTLPCVSGTDRSPSGAGGTEKDLLWGAATSCCPEQLLSVLPCECSRKQEIPTLAPQHLLLGSFRSRFCQVFPLCIQLCSGQQELGSPLVIRAAMNSSCPVSNQDLNISSFWGFVLKFPVFIMVVEKSRGGR